MRKTITILVLGVIILGLMMGCMKDTTKPVTIKMKYELFYVGSMPCVWAEGYRNGGLTCDWTRWTGE